MCDVRRIWRDLATDCVECDQENWASQRGAVNTVTHLSQAKLIHYKGLSTDKVQANK